MNNPQYVREMLERELQTAQDEFDFLKREEETIYNRIADENSNYESEFNRQISIAQENGLSEDEVVKIRSQFDLIQQNENDEIMADTMMRKMINELDAANMKHEYMGADTYEEFSSRLQLNIENFRYEYNLTKADIANSESLMFAHGNGCSDAEILEVKRMYRATEISLNSDSQLDLKNALNEQIQLANNEYAITGDPTVYNGLSEKCLEHMNSVETRDTARYTLNEFGDKESLLKDKFMSELEQANISEADKKTLIQDFEKTKFFADQELTRETQELLLKNLRESNEKSSYEYLTDDSLKIVDEGMLRNSEVLQQDSKEFTSLLDIAQQNDIYVEDFKETFQVAQKVTGPQGANFRETLISELKDVIMADAIETGKTHELTDELVEELPEHDHKSTENFLDKEDKDISNNSLPKDLQKKEMTDALNKVVDSCKETGQSATFKIQDQTIKVVPTIGKDGKKDFSIFLNGQKSSISKVADKLVDKASNVTAVTKAIKFAVKVAQKIKEQAQKTKETIKGAMEQSVR